MSKLFYNLVYDQIWAPFKVVSSNREYGFCKGKTTTEYQIALLGSLKNCNQIDTTYTDVTKA